MNFQLIRFDRYPAGESDFGMVGSSLPEAPLMELNAVVESIGQAIAGVSNARWCLVVQGHSDRQDRADLDCNQRRQSEIATAQARADSAWEWIRGVIADYASQNGWTGGDWWDVSDRVAWDIVYVSTGMLLNGSADDAERAKNRRVDFLFAEFAG